MAANCLGFNQDRTPQLVNGENFICVDENIDINVQSGGGYPGASGCYFGRGKLYLTNLRFIFVPNCPMPSFHSFYIPYTKVSGEKVDYPLIFGKDNIQGRVEPLMNGGLASIGTFTFEFPSKELAKSFWELVQTQLYNTRLGVTEDRVLAALHESVCVARPVMMIPQQQVVVMPPVPPMMHMHPMMQPPLLMGAPMPMMHPQQQQQHMVMAPPPLMPYQPMQAPPQQLTATPVSNEQRAFVDATNPSHIHLPITPQQQQNQPLQQQQQQIQPVQQQLQPAVPQLYQQVAPRQPLQQQQQQFAPMSHTMAVKTLGGDDEKTTTTVTSSSSNPLPAIIEPQKLVPQQQSNLPQVIAPQQQQQGAPMPMSQPYTLQQQQPYMQQPQQPYMRQSMQQMVVTVPAQGANPSYQVTLAVPPGMAANPAAIPQLTQTALAAAAAVQQQQQFRVAQPMMMQPQPQYVMPPQQQQHQQSQQQQQQQSNQYHTVSQVVDLQASSSSLPAPSEASAVPVSAPLKYAVGGAAVDNVKEAKVIPYKPSTSTNLSSTSAPLPATIASSSSSSSSASSSKFKLFAPGPAAANASVSSSPASSAVDNGLEMEMTNFNAPLLSGYAPAPGAAPAAGARRAVPEIDEDEAALLSDELIDVSLQDEDAVVQRKKNKSKANKAVLLA